MDINLLREQIGSEKLSEPLVPARETLNRVAETARKESSVQVIGIKTIVFFAIVSALVAVAVAAATNIWFGLATFIFTVGGFTIQSLRQIPAAPPTRGVLTIFGRRIEQTLNEGFVFLPFYPWVFGFIPVKITKVNLDLKEEKVRTPDFAELSVSVSVTYTPDEDHLIEFLNTGGEAGVNGILDDVIPETLRTWASSPNPPSPQTWEAFIQTQEETTEVLIQKVIGGQLPPNLVEELRQGNAVHALNWLGVKLNRLNIREILPLGAVATSADLLAKERREREAEKLELEHVRDRIRELMIPPPQGPGFSAEQALEVIQTERGKVKKEIREVKGNLSPETRAMIERIAPEALARIFGPRQGGQP